MFLLLLERPVKKPVKDYMSARENNRHVMLFLHESEKPVKSTTVVEQVDEYVDTRDEMPAATYQSMEIEKDAEEPHNVTVYKCGGCGTTLRAKICASNGQHVAAKQARQDSDSYSVAIAVSNGQPFQTKSKAQRAPSMLMLLASSMEAI
ncbi:hypothetical protein ZEAMMB73_Zm00001d029593 [Zea mays]|uniref:Enhanced disease resistance 4-like N-terminal domain-containing protein n=1 Tax=Zea mays TaxID=4577 RepID=A0A1D6K651_MAIZE|nr:hypothetical protein ZEAMMB73_Zm00001d029593 [Zea mays]